MTEIIEGDDGTYEGYVVTVTSKPQGNGEPWFYFDGISDDNELVHFKADEDTTLGICDALDDDCYAILGVDKNMVLTCVQLDDDGVPVAEGVTQ